MINKNILLSLICFTIALLLVPQSYASNTTDGEVESFAQEIQSYIEDQAESSELLAQNRRSRQGSQSSKLVSLMRKAKALAAAGDYDDASMLYFRMSRSPSFRSRHISVRYQLGLLLYELKLYQVSAFVFFDVINRVQNEKKGRKYLEMSMDKLSLISNHLQNDVLLKYAISKIRISQFPSLNKQPFYFRVGEIKLENKEYAQAAKFFNRITRTNALYPQAKYKEALAYAEMGQLNSAFSAFRELESTMAPQGITDNNRVNAMLGMARVFYQRKRFDLATEAYRRIPRDTWQWHDSLFENSWSLMRTGKFRSALSNFQTLHSSYYEDFYLPESLILRSIVYFYICSWSEMDKTLKLFNKIYVPVRRSVAQMLNSSKNSMDYFEEIWGAQQDLLRVQKGDRRLNNYQLPYLLLRHFLREGDIRQNVSYYMKLLEEEKAIKSLPGQWQKSSVGKYAVRILQRRIDSTKIVIGKLVRRSLFQVSSELRELSEQGEFLRLEQLTGEKEQVKKELAGKGIRKTQIDEDNRRGFYIQNGFEYWPFEGEYWLDELGNYHYVGVQNCKF